MLATRLKGAAKLPSSNIEYVGGRTHALAGTTSNTNLSLTSLTGGLASSPAANDLVVIYFGVGSASGNRDLQISGYTVVADLNANDDSDANLLVAYKFMSSTPDTQFTVIGGTTNVADAGTFAIQVWRNVDQTTPMDVTATTSQVINTAIIQPPAITPVTSGAVILAGGAAASDEPAGIYSQSTPAQLSNFLTTSQSDNNDSQVGLGSFAWVSGTFTPNAFLFSKNDDTGYSYCAATIALRPA